jgi:abhydrolase domain-containing protein 6
MWRPSKGSVALFSTVLAVGGIVYYRFPGLIVQSVLHSLRVWAGVKRHEVQVDDHCWVYLDGRGKGDPILFIHGFGADKDRWGTFLPPFSKRHRIIVPDLPGFGESSQIPSAKYDIPSQAERLHRFTDQLGLDSFHLLGISMGGYIAGYFASEYPQKVKSLALVDAAGVKSRVASDFLTGYREKEKIVLLYKDLSEFDEMVSMLFYRSPRVPRRIRAYLAENGIRRHEINRKILQDVAHGDAALLESRLDRILAPTLIIWGAEDRIIDVSSVEKFEKGIRNSFSVVIPQCGHVPYVEKPYEMKKAYREFLEGLTH